MRRKILALIGIFAFLFCTFPKATYAIAFDLIAPSGTLTMGQTVTYTINIDTQGKSLQTTEIGVTYDTQYLQFLNVTPGDTFSTVTATPLDGGKIVISGSSTTAYSGQGTFAYLNLKLIAGNPGSTDLCVLWAPSPTPSPTSALTPTSTPVPGTTTYPAPTVLPTSGGTGAAQRAGVFGITFVSLALGIFAYSKICVRPHKKHK